MSAKDAVIEFVKSLPDGASLPDVMDAIDARFGTAADGTERDLNREEWEDAWGAEAERRLADLDAGRTVGIPHDQVMREMREKYG